MGRVVVGLQPHLLGTGARALPPRHRGLAGMDDKCRNLRLGLGALGLILVVVGAWMGRLWAPAGRELGEAYRIICTPVPAMWLTRIGGFTNFLACVACLVGASWKADSRAEASAEVGLMFGVYGLVLG